MDNREAVARALYKFGCENVVGGEDCPFEEQDPETYEITIGLADAAISAIGQAQVKDLVWREETKGYWFADDPFGSELSVYRAHPHRDGQGYWAYFRDFKTGVLSSVDEAKSQADAHHKARVLSALSPAPVSGWQPIESAPKDGTCVLSLTGTCVEPIVWCDTLDDDMHRGWCGMGSSYGGVLDELHYPLDGEPTHWMSLPTPPEDAS